MGAPRRRTRPTGSVDALEDVTAPRPEVLGLVRLVHTSVDLSDVLSRFHSHRIGQHVSTLTGNEEAMSQFGRIPIHQIGTEKRDERRQK